MSRTGDQTLSWLNVQMQQMLGGQISSFRFTLMQVVGQVMRINCIPGGRGTYYNLSKYDSCRNIKLVNYTDRGKKQENFPYAYVNPICQLF